MSCEFERWNQIKIVDADNHRVSREAIREKVVRLKRDDLNEANALFLSRASGATLNWWFASIPFRSIALKRCMLFIVLSLRNATPLECSVRAVDIREAC